MNEEYKKFASFALQKIASALGIPAHLVTGPESNANWRRTMLSLEVEIKAQEIFYQLPEDFRTDSIAASRLARKLARSEVRFQVKLLKVVMENQMHVRSCRL